MNELALWLPNDENQHDKTEGSYNSEGIDKVRDRQKGYPLIRSQDKITSVKYI